LRYAGMMDIAVSQPAGLIRQLPSGRTTKRRPRGDLHHPPVASAQSPLRAENGVLISSH
jgi:hypothetical protein